VWASVFAVRPARPATPPLPKVVALTFDDGPSPRWTPTLLSLLARYHAHATFFILGSEAARYPALVRAIAAQGSAVGNHGYDHLNLFRVGAQVMWQDAEKTARWLHQEHIAPAPFYRPPYGNTSPALVQLFTRHGYTVTLWSIDTLDWTEPPTSAIVRRVLSHIKPGAIVLMHDSGGNREHTVQAVDAILQFLTADGYRVVSLPVYVRDLHLKTPTRLPPPPATAPSGLTL
jgi:peptidoglycan/xylan/chitin deacetylase (PgdA/CDA1 family)